MRPRGRPDAPRKAPDDIWARIMGPIALSVPIGGQLKVAREQLAQMGPDLAPKRAADEDGGDGGAKISINSPSMSS